MFLTQIMTNLSVFLMGMTGLVFSSTNMLIILMCIEMILLSTNLNFIVMSIYLDDFTGQMFSLIMLTMAAAESAIGLAMLILYYSTLMQISVLKISLLKG